MQLAALVQYTELRTPLFPWLGLGTIAQDMPFQLSMRVLLPSTPTATQLIELVQDTALMPLLRLAPAPTFGLGTIAHAPGVAAA